MESLALETVGTIILGDKEVIIGTWIVDPADFIVFVDEEAIAVSYKFRGRRGLLPKLFEIRLEVRVFWKTRR